MKPFFAALISTLAYTVVKLVALGLVLGALMDGEGSISKRAEMYAYLDGFGLLVFVLLYGFLINLRWPFPKQ